MSKTDAIAALQQKANKVLSATEKLMEHTRDWQVIKQFMQNRLAEIELSPEQERKLERYQFVYNQLISGKYTDQEVINQLTNKKFYGLSITQAYEDIAASKELFGTILNVNKQFEIHLALQLNQIRTRKAEEAGDMKAVAAFEKNRAAMLKDLPEVEDNPAELFEGHTIEAVFDPRLLGAPAVDMKEVLRVINEKRKVPIKIDMFEELDFEENS